MPGQQAAKRASCLSTSAVLQPVNGEQPNFQKLIYIVTMCSQKIQLAKILEAKTVALLL